jgi:hypothetical protein
VFSESEEALLVSSGLEIRLKSELLVAVDGRGALGAKGGGDLGGAGVEEFSEAAGAGDVSPGFPKARKSVEPLGVDENVIAGAATG